MIQTRIYFTAKPVLFPLMLANWLRPFIGVGVAG